MQSKPEAFALSSFMLNLNLVRLLVFKGVISADEALDAVAESRQQLRALLSANAESRQDMLERDLLDYEALFRDVGETATDELLETLEQALERILEEDAEAAEEDG